MFSVGVQRWKVIDASAVFTQRTSKYFLASSYVFRIKFFFNFQADLHFGGRLSGSPSNWQNRGERLQEVSGDSRDLSACCWRFNARLTACALPVPRAKGLERRWYDILVLLEEPAHKDQSENIQRPRRRHADEKIALLYRSSGRPGEAGCGQG